MMNLKIDVSVLSSEILSASPLGQNLKLLQVLFHTTRNLFKGRQNLHIYHI